MINSTIQWLSLWQFHLETKKTKLKWIENHRIQMSGWGHLYTWTMSVTLHHRAPPSVEEEWKRQSPHPCSLFSQDPLCWHRSLFLSCVDRYRWDIFFLLAPDSGFGICTLEWFCSDHQCGLKVKAAPCAVLERDAQEWGSVSMVTRLAFCPINFSDLCVS